MPLPGQCLLVNTDVMGEWRREPKAAGEPRAQLGPEAVFARRGWLAGASVLQRSAIVAMGRTVHVDRKARIFSAGDPPGGIYGVLSGGIGAEGATHWHAPRLGHVLRAGHWFGQGPILTGGRRSMGFVALEDSALLHVPLSALRPAMAVDAELSRLVGLLANVGSDLAIWVGRDLLMPRAPQRIAAVLLRVTGAHEGVTPDDPRGFLLTQASLGEMANASRNLVNRVLGDFVKAGWIATSYNHVRLLDPAAIARFAYEDRD